MSRAALPFRVQYLASDGLSWLDVAAFISASDAQAWTWREYGYGTSQRVRIVTRVKGRALTLFANRAHQGFSLQDMETAIEAAARSVGCSP